MRIKFDGKLFSQEDMQELIEALNASGVPFEPVLKNSRDRKGLPEIQNAGAWIAILANAFLPVLIQTLYDFFKNHSKGKQTVVIDIEHRSTSEQQSISLSLDDDIPEINILAKQDGELRVFIKKASEDTPFQQ